MADTLRLRVIFQGSYYPYDQPSRIEIYLETFLATNAFDKAELQITISPGNGSMGTRTIILYIPMTSRKLATRYPSFCAAVHAIGLDWLVVTDHSCDLDDVDPDVSSKTRWQRLEKPM